MLALSDGPDPDGPYPAAPVRGPRSGGQGLAHRVRVDWTGLAKPTRLGPLDWAGQSGQVGRELYRKLSDSRAIQSAKHV